MRKNIAVLLVTALTIAIAGCASQQAEPPQLAPAIESNEPKDTPHRVGTVGAMSGRIASMTFEETMKEADLVVDLTIVGWIGESLKQNELATYFSAKINHTFKGDEHNTIVLHQNGNSEWTYDVDPLFKKGDRLFLFLNKIPYEEWRIKYDWTPESEYENAFYII